MEDRGATYRRMQELVAEDGAAGREIRFGRQDKGGAVMRKPVCMGEFRNGIVLLVCDDGSTWLADLHETWREQDPVPGTQRAHELSDPLRAKPKATEREL